MPEKKFTDWMQYAQPCSPKLHSALCEYMRAAYEAATNSPDPSSQNGAVVVSEQKIIATSWNRFPPRVKVTPERLANRDIRLGLTVHAEVAAMTTMATLKESSKGTTLVCPWAACEVCADVIADAHVAHVIVHKDRMELTHAEWGPKIVLALETLRESGVKVAYVEGKLNAAQIRVAGQPWNP